MTGDITVTVSGPAQSGKTGLAARIAAALASDGWEVHADGGLVLGVRQASGAAPLGRVAVRVRDDHPFVREI